MFKPNNSTEFYEFGNHNIDELVRRLVFDPNKEQAYLQIKELSGNHGIFPASIQTIYKNVANGMIHGFTVPAINIRGITYDIARSIFRAMIKNNVGVCIFEIARSEMEYTRQTPMEFAGCILAAAISEKYRGPLFLQGDHIQISRKNYFADHDEEIKSIKTLINELIKAGFYNIDIDSSTLVDVDIKNVSAQQIKNGSVTAELTAYIRSLQPDGIEISVGGEIGEIGMGNSTVEDLNAFMERYNSELPQGLRGISKISVQTGTKHGGVVKADGTIADVKLDFAVLHELSKLARESYALGGAVQHGASTLPDELLDMFPKHETLEIHLATAFQNIIFDSPYFPETLRNEIYSELAVKYHNDFKENESESQFYYRNRKRAFGDFKRKIWDIDKSNLEKILKELETRFSFIFNKLRVTNTTDII